MKYVPASVSPTVSLCRILYLGRSPHVYMMKQQKQNIQKIVCDPQSKAIYIEKTVDPPILNSWPFCID